MQELKFNNPFVEFSFFFIAQVLIFIHSLWMMMNSWWIISLISYFSCMWILAKFSVCILLYFSSLCFLSQNMNNMPSFLLYQKAGRGTADTSIRYTAEQWFHQKDSSSSKILMVFLLISFIYFVITIKWNCLSETPQNSWGFFNSFLENNSYLL